tara:strand:+ start:675 stop:821 length:147 start_codon:yes stop_codon:yes gene_type:complete
MTKKKNTPKSKAKWPFYGVFRTKRDQVFIARDESQLKKAKRLKWKKLK